MKQDVLKVKSNMHPTLQFALRRTFKLDHSIKWRQEFINRNPGSVMTVEYRSTILREQEENNTLLASIGVMMEDYERYRNNIAFTKMLILIALGIGGLYYFKLKDHVAVIGSAMVVLIYVCCGFLLAAFCYLFYKVRSNYKKLYSNSK